MDRVLGVPPKEESSCPGSRCSSVVVAVSVAWLFYGVGLVAIRPIILLLHPELVPVGSPGVFQAEVCCYVYTYLLICFALCLPVMFIFSLCSGICVLLCFVPVKPISSIYADDIHIVADAAENQGQ